MIDVRLPFFLLVFVGIASESVPNKQNEEERVFLNLFSEYFAYVGERDFSKAFEMTDLKIGVPERSTETEVSKFKCIAETTRRFVESSEVLRIIKVKSVNVKDNEDILGCFDEVRYITITLGARGEGSCSNRLSGFLVMTYFGRYKGSWLINPFLKYEIQQ